MIGLYFKRNHVLRIAALITVFVFVFSFALCFANPYHELESNYNAGEGYSLWAVDSEQIDLDVSEGSYEIAHCRIGYFFYVSTDSGKVLQPLGWNGKPAADKITLCEKGLFSLKRSYHAVLSPEDRIAFEVQSGAIGTYTASIYAERNGEWVEVAKEELSSDELFCSVPAVAEYTVKSGDTRVKAVARYSMKDNGKKKPVEDGFTVMIDVGTPGRYLTAETLDKMTYPAYILFFALSSLLVLYRYSYVVKRKKDKTPLLRLFMAFAVSCYIFLGAGIFGRVMGIDILMVIAHYGLLFVSIPLTLITGIVHLIKGKKKSSEVCTDK